MDVGCCLVWLLSVLDSSWEKYIIELLKMASENAHKYGLILIGTLLNYSF